MSLWHFYFDYVVYFVACTVVGLLRSSCGAQMIFHLGL